jgi:hypothetical protein
MLFRHICGLTVLALALGVTASQASAQQIYKGTVNLPFETHWGGATLQPGLHTISIEAGYNGIPMIHVHGQGEDARILTGAVSLEPVSGRGRLTLVNVSGKYLVKRFDAGLVGKAFDFAVPRMKRSEAERAAAESTTTVPVAGNF